MSRTFIFDISHIQHLSQIQILDIGFTKVDNISAISKLNKIRELYIYDTNVRDISSITSLSSLEILHIRNCSISGLDGINNLHALKMLFCHETLISNLSPVSHLINMTDISFSNTLVSDLSPLSKLINLQKISFAQTPVSDLSPLYGLDNLKQVSFENSYVDNLSPLLNLIKIKIPVKWLTRDEDSLYIEGEVIEPHSICVKNCPFTNPPVEIVKQGNDAILRYFEEKERLEKDQTTQPALIKVREAKVLLVGQGKSGKTTLRKKLEDANAKMPEPGDTTRGIEITRLDERMPHTGEPLRLNLWDFGGQDIQHYAHQFFLTGSSLYALVTNERIQDSVHLPYWLNIIEMLGKKSPVILIQNKDGGHCQPLKDEAAIRSRFGNVYNRIFQSDFSQAATETEFSALRKKIIEVASELPHIEKEYLRSFNDLRQKLETEADQEKHYLRWDDYLQLMPELGEDLMRDYANALTFLGVCQYFPDDALLSEYIFLRPKWLIDALFELLLHPSLEPSRGLFSERDTRNIWKGEEYRGMHALLVRMMKEFELCYRVEGDEEKYIVPQRLPGENKTYGWNVKGDVPIQFRYKFMPKGILTRLICRMHSLIEKDPELGQRVWNDAVIFTLPEGKGMVFAREVYSENTIELRATGEKHAELLNEVIRKMDNINRDTKYDNLQVEKMVPCPCAECAIAESPGFHEFDALQKRIEKGKATSECKKSGEDVPINEIFGKSGVKRPLSFGERHLSDKGAFWTFSDNKISEQNSAEEKPLRIFISYSKHDNRHKDNLLKQLSGLRDQVITWHDRDILGGEDWDQRIKTVLNEVDVVLYLVTSNSIATEYIQNVELPLIEQRCKEGACILIPVIVDFCVWTELDFAKHNALPEKGVAITDRQWKNQNEAWVKVIQGVQRILAAR